MPFHFVHITADQRTPDANTRKQIRSQVMKDYRKKRGERLGNDAATSTGRSSFPTVASPSRSTSKQAGPELTPLPPRLIPGGSSSKRGRPSSSEQAKAASLFLQTAHGLFSNFTVRLEAKNQVAARDVRPELNVACDDEETSRMTAICDDFNHWLDARHSQIARLLAPKQVLTTTTSLQRLYALTLLSIGHLSSLRQYEADDDRAYYKTKLLEYAAASLRDDDSACSNSTLAALACLTSYEISVGSHEALTHLSGIARIIEWRGGFHNIRDRSLVLLLQTIDLLHSVYFHVDTVLITPARDWSSQSSNDEYLDAAREWQDPLREAASYLHEQDSLTGSRACYLAWRILTFQPKEDAPSFPEATNWGDELFTLMHNANAWCAQPALQARMLLTGLSTATNPSRKAWYYTSLSHLIFHTQAQYWDEFKSLVLSFIESQVHYRRPVVQTVRAMVSGVEIVIARELAAQLGLQTLSSSTQMCARSC